MRCWVVPPLLLRSGRDAQLFGSRTAENRHSQANLVRPDFRKYRRIRMTGGKFRKPFWAIGFITTAGRLGGFPHKWQASCVKASPGFWS
jgi:hypothetical protein